MGGACSTNAGNAKETADFHAARTEILKGMDSPDWDDGSYAPVLIRLGWHSSGTYCKADGTGGSNAATMRHPLEANDPGNTGLEAARKLLEPIKEKFPGVSFADLWVLAAYSAIEHTGGPKIDFRGGRTDAPEEQAIAPGRLPDPEVGVPGGMDVDDEGRINGWEKSAAHIREVFGRMGFSDREMVALICGGHVYGRCHNEHTGYAGAWVENPTRFSNEYAADMFGDKWILVGHDTKMPDGGAVPEEVRPSPGKRQYIDLTKYEESREPKTAKEVSKVVPEGSEPGKYQCVSDWVNVREGPDTSSPVIGRFDKDLAVNVVAVCTFGKAVRGQAERGGWISIVGSGGKVLFERKGGLDLAALAGTYRPRGGVPCFESPEAAGGGLGDLKEETLDVSEVRCGKDDSAEGAIFGKHAKGWALLHSPQRGALAELIVKGYNEKPRQPLAGQTGHQMMLITDMVMLWDEKFKAVLQGYADDEGLLAKEFGAAFKRLTELGCPWSRDKGRKVSAKGVCPHAK